MALRTVSARSSLGGGVPEGPTPGHCGRGSGGCSGQCNPRTSHFCIRAGGKGEPKQNAALIIGHVAFSFVSLSCPPSGRREGGAKGSEAKSGSEGRVLETVSPLRTPPHFLRQLELQSLDSAVQCGPSLSIAQLLFSMCNLSICYYITPIRRIEFKSAFSCQEQRRFSITIGLLNIIR